MTRKHVVLFLAIGLVITGALVLADPAPAAPPVSWSPSSLSEEVVAGESLTIPVSLTAGQELEDAVVRVVPELEAVVSVIPSELGDIVEGQTVELEVTLAPPVTMDPTLLEGVVQLRQDSRPSRTYAKPLPVELEVVWPTVGQSAGFTVSYPPTLGVETVTREGQRRVLFYRDQADESGENALFLIHITPLRQASVYDSLIAGAVSPEDIQEVVVGTNSFFRFVQSAIGDAYIGYRAQYDTQHVITVALFDSQFEATADFQAVLASLDY